MIGAAAGGIDKAFDLGIARGYQHVEVAGAQTDHALIQLEQTLQQVAADKASHASHQPGVWLGLQTGLKVGARTDDLAVELVNGFGHLGRAAAGDFFDAGQAVFFVAGVDALGAVAAVKVLVEFETTEIF